MAELIFFLQIKHNKTFSTVIKLAYCPESQV